MDRRLLRNVDPWLLACVLLILAFGAVVIYSATAGAAGKAAGPAGKLKLQLLWICLGLVLLAAVAVLDYAKIARLRWLLYVVVLSLLVAVLVRGHAAGGARRWLALGPLNLQPAELSKLVLVLVVAGLLTRDEENRASFATVFATLISLLVPIGLIFLQPDLGTPVIIVLIWLMMLFTHGARPAHLGLICAVGIIMFGMLWASGAISDYQKQRITIFLHPDVDPQGAGYHINQAKIAIGSGGLAGKGLLKGTQSKLGFIPGQETDFPFAVLGEELGFIGATSLLALYAFLLWRGLFIAGQAKDHLGRMIAVGITAMLFCHVFVNIGMNVGLLPVKGLPLPFFSYGGSNLLVNCLAVGMLESIHMRRQKIAF